MCLLLYIMQYFVVKIDIIWFLSDEFFISHEWCAVLHINKGIKSSPLLYFKHTVKKKKMSMLAEHELA